MKKIYTILAVLCLALGAQAGTEFTFTSADDMNQTKDGFTVVIAKGSGNNAPYFTTDYETQQPEMRLYLGNTIAVSSESEMTKIELVFAKSSASNKQYAGLSASDGNLVSGGESTDKNDWKIDTWTGKATNVVFTLTDKGQRRIKQLVVNGDSIEIVIPEDEPLPTVEDLDTNYVYAEQVAIQVPDTQMFDKEYAFIDNNILVHCTEGSIVFASEDEAAYFGCQAGQQLTFTATDTIKGIAINGNVRKLFGATCDKGELAFLTNEDLETAANPVLIVRNVDATSVTIDCVKNLSCYGVTVYFKENPKPLDDEEGISNANANTKAIKVLRDGQLIIIRGEKEYNVLGTQL